MSILLLYIIITGFYPKLLFNTLNGSTLSILPSYIFDTEAVIVQNKICFIKSQLTSLNAFNCDFSLYAVPKKKPSHRRTRIRKTAWMKRFPKNYKRPMMLDMYDIVKYTDGTLTKARTTYQNWLNLPNTTLEDDHILTRAIRRTW